MNKIQRSIRLLKAAFAVLFREKKLLLFPLVATGLAFVVALFFLAPIALYPTGHSYFSGAHWHDLAQMFFDTDVKPGHTHGNLVYNAASHPWTALYGAAAYFVSMFLATYCNVAFYHEIMQALNGEAVSIRRGFRFAAARWQSVLLWSLFAGLVGYLINTIEQQFSLLGRLITGFIGITWSIACIFVIPTLVRENQTNNPLKLLRRSARTLKRTWGELVIGHVGLDFAYGVILIAVVALALIMGGVAAVWTHHWSWWWISTAIMGELLVLAIPIGLISSVVNPVYRCALYIYATEGVVPGSFDQELLDSAWKVK